MSAIRVFICGLVLAQACASAPPKPATREPLPPPAPNTTAFEGALDAIRHGEIDRLLAFKGEASDGKLGDFLRQVWVRYGRVEAVTPLAVENAGPVSRGAFLVAHEYGPFVWDIITDGITYPMLRASNELGPYLRPAAPPSGAVALASTTLDRLNAGKATEVFPYIVCRCMTEAEFRKQVETLVRHGGAEVTRRLVRSETIPGLEDRLAIMHYLSERGSIRLGFHFTLWKVKDEWRINGVNWTQEELMPAPALGQMLDGRRQTPTKPSRVDGRSSAKPPSPSRVDGRSGTLR